MRADKDACALCKRGADEYAVAAEGAAPVRVVWLSMRRTQSGESEHTKFPPPPPREAKDKTKQAVCVLPSCPAQIIMTAARRSLFTPKRRKTAVTKAKRSLRAARDQQSRPQSRRLLQLGGLLLAMDLQAYRRQHPGRAYRIKDFSTGEVRHTALAAILLLAEHCRLIARGAGH